MHDVCQLDLTAGPVCLYCTKLGVLPIGGEAYSQGGHDAAYSSCKPSLTLCPASTKRLTYTCKRGTGMDAVMKL